MKKQLIKVKDTIKKELPKTKKGKILGIILGIGLPTLLGVAAGIVIGKFMINPTTDYGTVNESEITDNTFSKTLEKYAYAKENEDVNYEDVLKPYEMINIAYHLYGEYEHTRSWTKGEVLAAIVTQSIRGCAIRDGNQYFEESLSKSSMVGVATRTYVKEDTSVDLYRGDIQSELKANWPDEHYEYTNEEYVNDFGKTPETPLIYIVSKKTVIANNSSVTKDGNNYIVKVSLDPVKSVLKYVRQMKTISNLYEYPSFTSVDLTATLDQNLLIKTLEVKESYSAKINAIIGSSSDASLTITYEVGGDYKIPQYNEDLIYPEGF